MFRIIMMMKLMMEAETEVAACGVKYFWMASVPLICLGSVAENTRKTDSL